MDCVSFLEYSKNETTMFFMSRRRLKSAAISPATLFVLLALAKAPAGGSEIREQVLADTVGAVVLGHSSVYALIKELERDGLVQPTPYSLGAIRRYQLTATGRRRLAVAARLFSDTYSLARHRVPGQFVAAEAAS